MEAYSHREDQKVRVSIEASDFTCEGLVHLPGIRLSDVMNEKSDFMVLVDALVFRKSRSRTRRSSFGRVRSSSSSRSRTRAASAVFDTG